MTVCRSFSTTPDVASRLLSPAWRDLTRACLEYVRAERVIGEFRAMSEATDEQKTAIARRWTENEDGPFFAELLRAAGRKQPALDEA